MVNVRKKSEKLYRFVTEKEYNKREKRMDKLLKTEENRIK